MMSLHARTSHAALSVSVRGVQSSTINCATPPWAALLLITTQQTPIASATAQPCAAHARGRWPYPCYAACLWHHGHGSDLTSVELDKDMLPAMAQMIKPWHKCFTGAVNQELCSPPGSIIERLCHEVITRSSAPGKSSMPTTPAPEARPDPFSTESLPRRQHAL